MLRSKLVFQILGVLSCLVSGCENETGMEMAVGRFSCINSGGDTVVILAGLKVKGHDGPGLLETRPVLLQMNEALSVQDHWQLDDEVFREMAWRPGPDNALYYMTYEKVYGSGHFYEPSSGKWFQRGTGTLMKLDIDVNHSEPVRIHQDQPGYTSLRWSPDGTILAGLVPESTSDLLNTGKLGLSYDGGRTRQLTAIDIHGEPVWQKNCELLVMTDFDSTISKISFGDSEVVITEKVKVIDCQIVLVGALNEEPVYIAFPRKDEQGRIIDKARRLFVGKKLVYETDNPAVAVFTSQSTLAFEADGKVLVFDKNLALCHERRLKPKTHLLNVHPDTNTVFLVRDWKTILAYDFVQNKKEQVLFSVEESRIPREK